MMISTLPRSKKTAADKRREHVRTVSLKVGKQAAADAVKWHESQSQGRACPYTQGELLAFRAGFEHGFGDAIAWAALHKYIA